MPPKGKKEPKEMGWAKKMKLKQEKEKDQVIILTFLLDWRRDRLLTYAAHADGLRQDQQKLRAKLKDETTHLNAVVRSCVKKERELTQEWKDLSAVVNGHVSEVQRAAEFAVDQMKQKVNETGEQLTRLDQELKNLRDEQDRWTMYAEYGRRELNHLLFHCAQAIYKELVASLYTKMFLARCRKLEYLAMLKQRDEEAENMRVKAMNKEIDMVTSIDWKAAEMRSRLNREVKQHWDELISLVDIVDNLERSTCMKRKKIYWLRCIMGGLVAQPPWATSRFSPILSLPGLHRPKSAGSRRPIDQQQGVADKTSRVDLTPMQPPHENYFTFQYNFEVPLHPNLGKDVQKMPMKESLCNDSAMSVASASHSVSTTSLGLG